MTTEKKKTKLDKIKTLCEKRATRLKKSIQYFSEMKPDRYDPHGFVSKQLIKETQLQLAEVESVLILLNEKRPEWLEYSYENGELYEKRQAGNI